MKIQMGRLGRAPAGLVVHAQACTFSVVMSSVVKLATVVIFVRIAMQAMHLLHVRFSSLPIDLLC